MKTIAALIVLLVLAQPAQASWQEERALAIARVVWHNPCVDRARFVYVEQADIDRGTKLSGNERVAMRGNTTCTIYVGSMFRPEATYWIMWATLVLHEAGHLASYSDPANFEDPFHSLNPDSIMYWKPTPDPRVFDRGRPFLERHGVLPPRLPRHKKVS